MRRDFESHKITLKVRGFTIVSSSPYYSQGNEKVESAVKIVKNIFKKSKEEPYLQGYNYQQNLSCQDDIQHTTNSPHRQHPQV